MWRRFGVRAEAKAEALGEDLQPVAEEIDEDGEQRAQVQRDIEIESLHLPAEQPGGQVKVRGAADRQKFGEPLDDARMRT